MLKFRNILIRQHKYLTEWSNARSFCNLPLTTAEVTERRNQIFVEEQKKQLEAVGRVEKMVVDVVGPPEDITLIMNSEVSTPFDCAKHISLGLCQNAALALVNDSIYWDMHRPLVGNCKLQFLTFRDQDPYFLNKAFWRTGSFLLGALLCRVFKDEIKVHLHSFPPPFLKSGSFVYDFFINIRNWKPTGDELRVLSAEFLIFAKQNHKIERLKVSKSVAHEIFKDNPFKSQQLGSIVSQSGDNLVTLYRVGDHIDISTGPMVADTSFFGRCTIANVFYLNNADIQLYRIQGVALPKGILLNHFAYSVIENRAAQLNESDHPFTDKDLPRLSTSFSRLSEQDIPKTILHV